MGRDAFEGELQSFSGVRRCSAVFCRRRLFRRQFGDGNGIVPEIRVHGLECRCRKVHRRQFCRGALDDSFRFVRHRVHHAAALDRNEAQAATGRFLEGPFDRKCQAPLLRVQHREHRVGRKAGYGRDLFVLHVVRHAVPVGLFVAAEHDADGLPRDEAGLFERAHRKVRGEQRPLVVDRAAAVHLPIADLHLERVALPLREIAHRHHIEVPDQRHDVARVLGCCVLAGKINVPAVVVDVLHGKTVARRLVQHVVERALDGGAEWRFRGWIGLLRHAREPAQLAQRLHHFFLICIEYFQIVLHFCLLCCNDTLQIL